MKSAKGILQVMLLLLTALIAGVAWAQTSNGTLAGSVTDPTGAVVPKATVSAVSPQYGQRHETQTDAVGTYRLEGLQPGNYAVSITAPGFEILTVDGVVINGSLTTAINGKLKLAATRQIIRVQAAAAQVIDTQSGQLGGNISHEEVVQLPYGITARSAFNAASLALTLPGVQDSPVGNGAIQSSGVQTEGVSFSVNGSRPRANNFLIDGQDDNDYGIAGQAYQPQNVGAIQEVAILTNSYGAEYGRGGGSVTNYIYKSGTNSFHGDLWEINRNSALAAIPAQDRVSNPITKNPYDNENTFGFDAGGPVLKDKLFAFGAAQWDRERQSVTGPLFKLPTAAGIATLNANFPSNGNVNLLLNSIGSLVSPGLSGVQSVATGSAGACPCVEIGNFQVQNVITASNGVDWNFRMDWHFSGQDTLTGSAIRQTGGLSPDNFANPNALPNFQTRQDGTTEIFRGQWAHTISSKLVNELRMSYTNINLAFAPTPRTLAGPLANIPFIEFGNDVNLPSIGIDSSFPQGRGHSAWEIQDALSEAAGSHTIKVGADITVLSLADVLALNTRGTIEYASGGGFTSLGNFIADFTGGTPGSISKGFGNPSINSGATMFAPYIQDTWRIKKNLTLIFGLRYEYWGSLANSLPYPAFNTSLGFGVASGSYPSMFAEKQVPDKKNFAPRIGLAYSPSWGGFLTGRGKTTIRTGYGIYYDGLFSSIIDGTAESQPNTLGGGVPAQPGRGTPNASTTGIGGITPQVNPFLTIFTMASDLHNPMTQQWNVNIQRELPLGLVLTMAYVGTRGERLFVNQDFNPQGKFYSFTNPKFGEIAVRTNAADSKYHSGQIEVERKIHSFVLRGAYTYSNFQDDSSEIFTSTGSSSYAQDIPNQHTEWGPSTFDRRHRFTIAYVWGAPYFHHNALLRALTDRWVWSSFSTIETGTPNTVTLNFDNFGNGHPNSRPNLANPNAPNTSLGFDGAGFPLLGLKAASGIFDLTCLFFTSNKCTAEPLSTFHFIWPNGVPGNVGRNTLFGPGQIYFDTSIQRDFPVHIFKLENQTIQFRTEFFNALNHPNLFTPTYNMEDPNFANSAITISGGRQIRFWLKYSF